MSDFTDKIKQWVQVDNRVKTLNEELKEVRHNRNELTGSIFHYASENNLENAVIQISDGKLRFQNTRVPQALTLKFIKECLEECLGNQVDVNQIIDFIKEKREVKYTNDIKRFYNEKS